MYNVRTCIVKSHNSLLTRNSHKILLICRAVMALKLLRRSPNFVQLSFRGFASWLEFPNQKKTDDTAAVEPDAVMKNRRLSSRLQSMADSSDLMIRKQHPYQPRDGTREEVLGIAREVFGVGPEEDLLASRLDDPLHKYRLLTRCSSLFPRNVSNTELHYMDTVANVVELFCTPVEHEDGLYALSARDNLPRNLSIQKEPTRFHPATDKMFDGVTAFPGRDTIVSGLRFRRKYPGVKADKTVPRNISDA